MPSFSRKDRRKTPALYAIFMLGYAVFAMFMMEQRHTIEVQQALIHNLYEDSRMLTTIQLQQVHDHQEARARR